MNSIQLVVFDMAGTTVTDKHEVEYCFALAARETGLEMTDEEILAVQGWGKRHVFETFWERQLGQRNEEWVLRVAQSYQRFTEVLEAHYHQNQVLPTEGCTELFTWLKDQGIAIALTTGFYRKVTNIILGKLGWLEGLDSQHLGNANTIIQASIASDEVAKGRPAPDMILKAMNTLGINDPKTVINIGDTPSDIESGKRANCLYSCCVSNGTHTAQQLLPHNPDQAFDSLRGLMAFLKKEMVPAQ
ncbi:HAD hydrolase-like protein [Flavihumibacter rivuli]|uniref:HAD hydrolase-like protein n=1 Tax=Flavihumibacter rivuli TaxID=2838156 RepID=UPI001BDDEABA|nr:HAD hydrolase-like protein [Flavihumibacter rivuli]ULQ57014.1 HAD hydrolase-like protein [Flavihumibacter rivuli]